MELTFKPEEIKRRFRRKLIGAVIALLAGAPPSFVLLEAGRGNSTILGEHPLVWIIGSIAVIVAAVAFIVATWRCPSCGSSFGSTVYPATCPQCDVKLR